MTETEVEYIGESIKALAENHQQWMNEYLFDPACEDLEPKEYNPDLKVKEKMTRAILGNFIT